MQNSPLYRKSVKPVSVEDLQLGLHVGSAAVIDEFPMQPPSAHRIEIEDEEFTFADHPYLKALFAIKTAFADKGNPCAVFTRLTTLQEMAHLPGMEKWVIDHGIDHGNKLYEFADALLDVAATFPFRPGTYRFNLKPFLREVQRVADLKYGGKFT
jgi:hypothetical protein